MPKLDPYESIGFHCSLTSKAFFAAVETRMKDTGVSPAQFMALVNLMTLGPLSQTELVDRLSISKATGARLIDRMERDGWVDRQKDPVDSRIKKVVPTDKAIRIWDKISREGRELLDQAYMGIHPAELEMVKRVLARIRQNLGR